jgi:hypothetical protein
MTVQLNSDIATNGIVAGNHTKQTDVGNFRSASVEWIREPGKSQTMESILPRDPEMIGKIAGKALVIGTRDNITHDVTITEIESDDQSSATFNAYIEENGKQKCVGGTSLYWLTIKEDGKYGKYGSAPAFNFETQNKRFYGTHLNGQEIIRDGERLSKIYMETIDSLSNDKYKGIGTVLYQASIEYSIRKGCEGRLQLDAAWNSPGFHYKQGMRAEHTAIAVRYNLDYNQLIAEELSKAKAEGREPNTNGLNGEMYMPEEGIRMWKKKIADHPILFQSPKM